MRFIPNLLTFARILMTPFVLWELARGHYLSAGWLFGAAAFTDVLDGGIARRLGVQSKFGQYLDPVADKLMLSAIYIGLAMGHAVPVWVVLVIFARDFWILGLSAFALRFTQFRDLKPSVFGKVSTFCQIMAAVGIMAARAYEFPLFGQIADVLIWAVVALAAVSAADYTLRGLRYLSLKP